MLLRYLILSLSVVGQSLSAAIIFTDTFNGSGAPDAPWVTDTDGDSTANATVNVSGGSLNVNTGNVSGLSVARHTLTLSGTGAPTVTLGADWTIEVVSTIGSATDIPGIAAGEGVGVSFDVRNDNPFTSDRAQINFVNLDFGSGPTFAARGAHLTDDNLTETINQFGPATSALTATLRLSYNSANQNIYISADTGGGFSELVTPVDTSAWAMTDSDPLRIQFEMGLVKFSSDPANSTFSLENSDATIDSFTLSDVFTPTPIPEESSAVLVFLGMVLLVKRRRSAA